VRGHRDLELTAVAAPLCALLAIALPVPALSLLAVAPLAFFLPGYAITCACFARRELRVAHLLTFSLGLSLATLALLPLALSLLPGGISAASWAIGLSLVVLAACRGAAISRPRGRAPRARLPRVVLGPVQAGLLGLGGLAGVAAMVLAFTPMPAERASGYTELWIEPAGRREQAVRVGVGSREQETETFTVELRASGRPRPFEVRRFRLQPGGERTLLARPPRPGERPTKVSVTLFRFGQSQPYRRVAAWLPEER